MAFTHSDSIEVRRIEDKGRGVLARRLIRKGELIERVPMLVLPDDECEHGPVLSTYCFAWGRGTVALALGYGSIYKPFLSSQRSLRRCGAADEGVLGLAGHPARRGVHGQLQRRAEEPGEGLVRGRRGNPDEDERVE
jgi:hypothetical protein